MRVGPQIHYRLSMQTTPKHSAVGIYIGVLDFVEPSKTGPGQRTFTVTINNGPASDPIDVYALAGGANILYQYPFEVDANVGIADIRLDSVMGTNAVLSGIEFLIQEAGITCQQGLGTAEDFQPEFCYPNLRTWWQAGGPYLAQIGR